MSRISKSIVILALVFVWCAAAYGAAVPKYHMRNTPIRVDARDFVPPPSTGRTFAAPRNPALATTTPATEAGITYYDYQHNGSVGRQVVRGPGTLPGSNFIQTSWMKAPGPSVSIRTVNWNRTAVAGSPTPVTLDNGSVINYLPLSSVWIPGGIEFAAVRPGYTNTRNRPSGKNMTIFHDAPEVGGISYNEAQLDQSVGSGVFGAAGLYAMPMPDDPAYQSDGVIWPKQTITTCGSDLTHHVVGTWSGAANEVWYWKGYINDAVGSATWDPVVYPYQMDPLDAYISAVVEAYGEEISIVMLKQNNTTNADVIYYRSTDCGENWAAPVNITNYTSTGPEGGYTELNAVYDENGELHVIWNTAPANGQDYPTNVYHWSPTSGVRLITSAGWINSCVNGTQGTSTNNGAGTNNLAIADVGISVKPASSPWQNGQQLVYAVWTQFGPTNNDCSTVDAIGTLGGGVNGEVYMSVSSNGGTTWDRPQNVTGTVTPDCLPGDCFSESWVTVAAESDSGVYLSYVEDSHAGPVVFGGGAWSESSYRVYAPAARPPVLEPVIAVTPINFIELNAKPSGGTETVEMSVISVGNADLEYWVTVTNDDGGASHVLVEGGGTYHNTITAGGDPNVLTISYNAIGLTPDPSEWNWRIEVTSTDPTNDPGQGGTPIDVNLQVFAAEVWYECTDDTLSTGVHRMQVSSCLEMGDEGTIGTGFFNYSDSAEWMFSGSPVVTMVSGGDTLAFHNAFMSPFDRTRDENKSFRAQSEFNIVYDDDVVSGESTYVADRAYGTASTTDTTIQLDYEMLFYKSPQLAHGAVWKFAMKNITDAAFTDVDWGAAADIDLDNSASDNAGIGDEAKGYIGGVGGELDAEGNFTPNTNYMALFYLPPPGGCAKDGGAAAQVLGNPDYVHPTNQFEVDSLYALFERFGGDGSWNINIYEDTLVYGDDIAVMLVDTYHATLNPDVVVEWGYGLATSNVSISDLESTIENLRAAANTSCVLGCPIAMTGDVNVSGTLTAADIIYLVQFVFKGGNAPQPCAAAGDVNCSGTVTAADIIFMVQHVFKGGPPPCDACTSSLAGDC